MCCKVRSNCSRNSPSYTKQYADVEAMMRMPPAVMACSFARQLAFMESKLKNFEKMRLELQSPSESASAAEAALQQPMRHVLDGDSAAGGATEDLSCKEPSVKKFKTASLVIHVSTIPAECGSRHVQNPPDTCHLNLGTRVEVRMPMK